jgi:hypothetical protein
LPWSEGGLGLDIKAKNKCFLAKQLWNIHLKFDSLWICWVDYFYLPYNSLWSLERLHSSSLLWKSLCSLKDQLVVQLGGISETIATLHDWYQGPSSFIANAHEFFRLKGSIVSWHNVVSEQWSLPRYMFILWLVVLSKLRIYDYVSFLSTDIICVLCNQEDESYDHLFFSCDWSSLLWSHIKHWLRLNRSISSLSSTVRGLSGRSKRLHYRMRRVSLALLVHLIWNERNRRIFEHVS